MLECNGGPDYVPIFLKFFIFYFYFLVNIQFVISFWTELDKGDGTFFVLPLSS